MPASISHPDRLRDCPEVDAGAPAISSTGRIRRLAWVALTPPFDGHLRLSRCAEPSRHTSASARQAAPSRCASCVRVGALYAEREQSIRSTERSAKGPLLRQKLHGGLFLRLHLRLSLRLVLRLFLCLVLRLFVRLFVRSAVAGPSFASFSFACAQRAELVRWLVVYPVTLFDSVLRVNSALSSCAGWSSFR